MNTIISKDGTNIAYAKAGTGPALILVDGAFCSKDFGPMPKLTELLQNSFTVYSYDRRARGESGDTKPYSVQREVEDIEALINAAGGNAFLFGMSSGAILCVKAAVAGLNVTKMALYEPPLNFDNKHRSPPADYKQALQKMIKDGERSNAVKYFLTRVMGVPGIVALIIRLTSGWSSMKANANSLPYDAELIDLSTLAVEEIKSVTVPSLVVGGEKSVPMLRDAVKNVSSLLKNGSQKILAGQSHNVSMKVLAPVLLEFYLD